MAETPANEPIPSSSEASKVSEGEAVASDVKDDEGPMPKKRKIANEKEGGERLEHRLGGILCCAVCLDLPQAAVYQCAHGHLMCAPCFTHLLADARLRDEAATCPNCRVEISKTSASRNLAVEKTVSELPSECKYCADVFPRHAVQHHEEHACEERTFRFAQLVVGGSGVGGRLEGLFRVMSGVARLLLAALLRVSPATALWSAATDAARVSRRRLTGCRYSVLGCPWRGPWHEAVGHEASCARPGTLAGHVLPALAERDRRHAQLQQQHAQLLDLLSLEKITFNDLQLKPYRTEEFVHKLYYETSRFGAFGQQWVVKAFVNKHQRDPTQTNQREITYQLIVKSKPVSALAVQWAWLRGPWGEARLSAAVTQHVFAEDSAEAPPQPLPLQDPADANRLLSNKAIHCRLIMFLTTK